MFRWQRLAALQAPCERSISSQLAALQVRAMQILDALEPTRRGPYGGGIGLVSFTGGMDMALALRTMVIPTGGSFDYLYNYSYPRARREWTVHIQVRCAVPAREDLERAAFFSSSLGSGSQKAPLWWRWARSGQVQDRKLQILLNTHLQGTSSKSLSPYAALGEFQLCISPLIQVQDLFGRLESLYLLSRLFDSTYKSKRFSTEKIGTGVTGWCWSCGGFSTAERI